MQLLQMLQRIKLGLSTSHRGLQSKQSDDLPQTPRPLRLLLGPLPEPSILKPRLRSECLPHRPPTSNTPWESPSFPDCRNLGVKIQGCKLNPAASGHSGRRSHLWTRSLRTNASHWKKTPPPHPQSIFHPNRRSTSLPAPAKLASGCTRLRSPQHWAAGGSWTGCQPRSARRDVSTPAPLSGPPTWPNSPCTATPAHPKRRRRKKKKKTLPALEAKVTEVGGRSSKQLS